MSSPSDHSENPYEPPQKSEATGRSDIPVSDTTDLDAYQPQGLTLKWLIRLFILFGGINGILAAIDLLYATTQLPDTGIWIVYDVLAIGLLPIFLVTVVFYGLWIRRANRNARALGAANMQFTPGWCFGWFFVPIANLFRPYQAVRELYQTSSPSVGATGWERSPATLVWWWWMIYLLANFASQLASLVRTYEAESELVWQIQCWAGVVSGTLWIGASYLVAKVVISITSRQEDKRQAICVHMAAEG